jgi:hypothetical protein
VLVLSLLHPKVLTKTTIDVKRRKSASKQIHLQKMARETKYRSTSSFYLPSIEGGGKQHVLFAIRTANV